MEEREIVVLDEGVTAEQVAASATCCKAGAPTAIRTGPDA